MLVINLSYIRRRLFGFMVHQVLVNLIWFIILLFVSKFLLGVTIFMEISGLQVIMVSLLLSLMTFDVIVFLGINCFDLQMFIMLHLNRSVLLTKYLGFLSMLYLLVLLHLKIVSLILVLTVLLNYGMVLNSLIDV